jgi:hypothetical protein
VISKLETTKNSQVRTETDSPTQCLVTPHSALFKEHSYPTTTILQDLDPFLVEAGFDHSER